MQAGMGHEQIAVLRGWSDGSHRERDKEQMFEGAGQKLADRTAVSSIIVVDLTTPVLQTSERAVDSCVGKNFLTVQTQLPENEQIRSFVLASWTDMSPREEMLASIPDHVGPLCWGERTWRAIPPLGSKAFCFQGMLLQGTQNSLKGQNK